MRFLKSKTRQEQVLEIVRSYGCVTIDGIAKELFWRRQGFLSNADIKAVVSYLQRKGYVKREDERVWILE